MPFFPLQSASTCTDLLHGTLLFFILSLRPVELQYNYYTCIVVQLQSAQTVSMCSAIVRSLMHIPVSFHDLLIISDPCCAVMQFVATHFKGRCLMHLKQNDLTRLTEFYQGTVVHKGATFPSSS